LIPERNQSGAPKQSKLVSIPQIPVLGGYEVFVTYLCTYICGVRTHVPSRANLASADNMPNKRKADAAPDGAGAPKVGRGGGGRGGGRKRKAENMPGVDAADAPKRRQIDLGDVFGQAFKKKNTIGDLLGARKGAGGGVDVIEWDYVRHDGGEEDSSIACGRAGGAERQTPVWRPVRGGWRGSSRSGSTGGQHGGGWFLCAFRSRAQRAACDGHPTRGNARPARPARPADGNGSR
jgi:hypothetical protein